MGRVVGKRPLDKGGKGGGTGAFGRGSGGGGVSCEGAGRVWEERIRGRKASGEGGRRTGPSGAAGGRGFALGVWLLGKLRQGAPGASGRKKVAPGRKEPGRKHPELEFTLYAPGTSGGRGEQDATGRRAVFLLMYPALKFYLPPSPLLMT